MALPTRLELVNEVLVRLREPEVATVDQNTLSKLIGVFVNDAKRAVEDAYNWNALTQTLTATTVSGTFNYTLTGTGSRFKVLDVQIPSLKYQLKAASTTQMTQWLLHDSTQGVPTRYNFNGIDSNGDTQVDLYQIPDAAYSIYFNLYVPQEDLDDDTDTLYVPKRPVVQLAYAMALVERGEDGGLTSSEAYSIYKSILSDYIAIEASRYPEEDSWEAV
jgi:hypothetical protein